MDEPATADLAVEPDEFLSKLDEVDEFFDATTYIEAGEEFCGSLLKQFEEQPDLGEQIAALAWDGFSAEEIGKALEIPRARVIRIARRKGIELAKAGGRRRILVELSAKHVEMIGSLADGAKVTRAVMLARLALIALAEGKDRTRRRLGKHARPKRGYTKRRQT